MAARHRLPKGFKRRRARQAGTLAGWSEGMASAMAALYGHAPPMTPAEQAQHEQHAAAVPYRKAQGDLALRLPETD